MRSAEGMRTVLVVSPHFPPVNAPDMHRVRLSLPHFEEFGWRAIVLAVEPRDTGRDCEPALLETVPPGTEVVRVRALPEALTRRAGITALGVRAWFSMYWAGLRLLRRHRVDLVYISTTMFPLMSLGRMWKARTGIPFVLDLQDPWVGDYYETKPLQERPRKYRSARRFHSALEAWTMRRVDGLVAVSAAYHETVRRRYPSIPADLCETITFGASATDYDVARRTARSRTFWKANDGLVHGVYAGVLGPVMRPACRLLCEAFARGLAASPRLFSRVRLHFVGTDYRPAGRGVPTIRPLAEAMGLGEFIREEPARIPYLEVLRVLEAADFLVVPGSDDPDYTASKLYAYVMARKPLLAVLHERSGAAEALRATHAGELATFRPEEPTAGVVDRLLDTWAGMLARLPYEPATDWTRFEPFTARTVTQRQCDLFDRVLARHARVPFGARPHVTSVPRA